MKQTVLALSVLVVLGVSAASAAEEPTKPAAPLVSFPNGRPTLSSADGNQSASLRAVVQFDAADHHDGSAGASAVDFRRGSIGGTGNRENEGARDHSDGAYFRRARVGFEGKLARNFEYRLLLELGGAGTEGPTRINDAWVAYTGLGPFRLQIGAFAPPANMEDSTSVDDLIFIERPSGSELSRSLAGSDGRTAINFRGNGARWMSSIAFTSRTANDAEVLDSQFAAVGRFAMLAASSASYHIHVGASGTKVFQPADLGVDATGARYPLRFRERPEIRVDSTRLIDTGNIDADSAYIAAAELGMNWKNFLLQAEHFWYGIERRTPTTLPDPSFSSYYAQASWVITGEGHPYKMATGSFQAPRVHNPFTSDGGHGAWEVAIRFSHTDLDYRAGLAGTGAAADSVRGGVQDIWTFAVNWYVNSNVHLMLHYLHIDVDRLNPAGLNNPLPFGPVPLTPPTGAQIGQDLEVIALRTQFSF